MKMSVEN